MKWKRAQSYLRVLLYIVGLVFFVFFLQRNLINFFEKVKFSQINLFALFIAFIVVLIIYAFQMINIWIVIKGYFPKTTLLATVIAYASSFMPKYIPGYVWGYVSRGDSFKEIADVPYKTTVAVSILEILYFVSSGIFLLGINHILKNSLSPLLLLALFTLPVIEWYLIKNLGNHFFKLLKIDERVILSFKVWLIVFAISFFEWFIYGLSLALIHQALVQEKIAITAITLLNYSTIFSESWIAGFLVFLIPMGLGVRELLISRGFQRVMGINLILSGVIASVSRVLIILAEGLWFLVAITLRKRLTKPQ